MADVIQNNVWGFSSSGLKRNRCFLPFDTHTSKAHSYHLIYYQSQFLDRSIIVNDKGVERSPTVEQEFYWPWPFYFTGFFFLLKLTTSFYFKSTSQIFCCEQISLSSHWRLKRSAMPPKLTGAGGAKPAAKKKIGALHKLPDPIKEGEIVRDIQKRQWRLGKSIGVGGFGEIYAGRF